MNMLDRYSRQTNLPGFGAAAQQKLQNAKVLVVGAGGLGVPVLQYLTAMGVGTIGIADGDVVSLSNLNRQVMYAENEIGKLKVAAAAAKLSRLNSTITVNASTHHLTVNNALALMAEYDVIVDATDNIATRYLINDACIILNKPFIYGAVHQFEGHISVFNFNGGPTYRCLYPTFPSAAEVPDCNVAGVLGVVPGIIGCEQALEVVKVITGFGKCASGYLRIFDFLNNDQYKVKLKVKAENKQIQKLQDYYGENGCEAVQFIEPAELADWLTKNKELTLLDVRWQDEYDAKHFIDSNLIPLDELLARLDEIPNNQTVVTVCQKGGRSTKAAILLSGKNSLVYSLKGGIDNWQQVLGDKFLV
jgi:molybdopterin/thiamine biosynthesis adenylyltransferase/rhodanese-related sulfurtransferase